MVVAVAFSAFTSFIARVITRGVVVGMVVTFSAVASFIARVIARVIGMVGACYR